MTQSLSLRIPFFRGLLSFILCLAGCDDDWARRFDYGRVVPDFRFTITLPEPSTKTDLFLRFEELAELTGFPVYRGRPISDEMFEPSAKYSGFTWFAEDRSVNPYSVDLIWRPRAVENPSSLLVIFHNGSLDDFTEQEWLIFKKWKETYLPAVFPDATIEVTRHPAAYTYGQDLLEISRVTGIPIPEKYAITLTDSP